MDLSPAKSQHPSPTPTEHLQSPGHQQSQNRISFLQQALSSYGSGIMARVTRSSKHKTTPASSPTKPITTNADHPIKSVEAADHATRNKGSKGHNPRKPRKKRQRDVDYKIKKRKQESGGKNGGLATLNLSRAEQEALRAGFKGNKTSQKLADMIITQRAELDRLRDQPSGLSKSSEDPAVATPNNAAQTGSRRRQQKAPA